MQLSCPCLQKKSMLVFGDSALKTETAQEHRGEANGQKTWGKSYIWGKIPRRKHSHLTSPVCNNKGLRVISTLQHCHGMWGKKWDSGYLL